MASMEIVQDIIDPQIVKKYGQITPDPNDLRYPETVHFVVTKITIQDGHKTTRTEVDSADKLDIVKAITAWIDHEHAQYVVDTEACVFLPRRMGADWNPRIGDPRSPLRYLIVSMDCAETQTQIRAYIRAQTEDEFFVMQSLFWLLPNSGQRTTRGEMIKVETLAEVVQKRDRQFDNWQLSWSHEPNYARGAISKPVLERDLREEGLIPLGLFNRLGHFDEMAILDSAASDLSVEVWCHKSMRQVNKTYFREHALVISEQIPPDYFTAYPSDEDDYTGVLVSAEASTMYRYAFIFRTPKTDDCEPKMLAKIRKLARNQLIRR